MAYQNGRIKKEGNHKYLVEIIEPICWKGTYRNCFYNFHHYAFLRLTILST
jgi:uncharacterized protein YjlB